jgi:transposase InsO family protein
MVKRKRNAKKVAEDEELANRICKIKEEHPFWGYRRIWAWLRRKDGLEINDKKVYRIMKEKSLLCPRKGLRKVAAREIRAKPRASRSNEFWGTDMTKIYVEKQGWAYLVVVLDWFSKKIVGVDVAPRSRSKEWLEALNRAVNERFPFGVKGMGLHLVTDNGCQPTSIAYQDYCGQTGIEQIYTSYNNPRGNAETERVIRTMKEELLWLREWNDLEELKKAVESWVKDYNANYLHSALGYRSPEEFEGMVEGKSAVA